MTVRELIEILQDLDDQDAPVIVADDSGCDTEATAAYDFEGVVYID